MLALIHILPRCALLGLLLFACHDTKRNNPLDPQLTPAIELQVAVDDTAGVVRMSWTPYAGSQDFGDYLVLRAEAGSELSDTLRLIDDHTITDYIDSTATHGRLFVYRVNVRNRGGYEARSPAIPAVSLQLPPVELTEATFESIAATATLRWTPYPGPRFRQYRIERTADGTFPVAVAFVANQADTSYVDRGLRGNSEYVYRVVSETQSTEQIPSNERGGAFHRLVASWNVDITDDAHRLYAESSSGITLVGGRYQGQRDFAWPRQQFDSAGMIVAEELLIDSPRTLSLIRPSRPFATTVRRDGLRFTSIAFREGAISLLRSPPLAVEVARVEDFSPFPTEESVRENDTISLLSISPNSEVRGFVGEAHFQNIRIESDDGQILLQERFEGLQNLGSFTRTNEVLAVIDPWAVEGNVESSYGWLGFWPGMATHAFAASANVQVATDIVVTGGRGSVRIGGESGWVYELILDWDEQEMVLARRGPRSSADVDALVDSVAVPVQLIASTVYQLSLHINDGVPSASVRRLSHWQQWRENGIRFASLAALDDRLLLSVGNELLSIEDDGTTTLAADFASPVIETRVWTDSNGRARIGVCLPLANRIKIGTLFGQTLRFPDNLEIGAAFAGAQPGQLSWPISLDGAADGRIYVLDAGNSRIQVFDQGGNYLTEWGRKGSGAGEFDFGTGANLGQGDVQFNGSVAVGLDGYIYVLDVPNQRIQKFAP